MPNLNSGTTRIHWFIIVIAAVAFRSAMGAISEGEMDTEGNIIKGGGDCKDMDSRCSFWASIGECDKNPTYMHSSCAVSCGTCNKASTLHALKDPDAECDPNDAFCLAAKAQANVPKGSNPDGSPRAVNAKECLDRHGSCSNWASQGECDINPGWMIINCPSSCQACHLRDPKIRCNRENLNMSTTPAYKPGDMEAMFGSIMDRFGSQYDITVHSTSPWVVTFENFLTNAEADALIATQKKWERSTDSGKMNEFGEVGRVLSTGRTSSNSWCDRSCMANTKVSNLLSKIEDVIGIGRENYESFQVLRYEIGQKYNAHHDYGVEDVGKACGPRILTFFLYLSDVEEGGETAFPLLDIAVKPKKGRALLWPSTLDANPERIDARTRHEARPVVKGRKFAANSWIHLYNFNVPNLWGCTGTFDEA